MTILVDDQIALYSGSELNQKIEERILMLQKDLAQIHNQYIDSLTELEKQKEIKEDEFHKRREELMNEFITDLQNYAKEVGS